MTGILQTFLMVPNATLAFSASDSPNPVTGTNTTSVSGGLVAVATSSCTCSVTGGVGSFTYAWTFVSGTNATINSPSSASTTFTRTAAAPTVLGTSNQYNGTFRCTVTDTGNGNQTTTADVVVQTNHVYNVI